LEDLGPDWNIILKWIETEEDVRECCVVVKTIENVKIAAL
jgi:hypothetical protein